MKSARVIVMAEVGDEIDVAHGNFGPPTSTHEALGVLLEEFDELKEAIHANHAANIKHEATQVAAVACRLAIAIGCKNPAFFARSGLKL